MSLQEVGAALRRVKDVLERRPGAGLHDDPGATARWVRGTRTEVSHANGTKLLTDMPAELGGSGDQVSPGWMFRAGLASCTATVIAMKAAQEGVDLATLEVRVTTRSDSRGVLGMSEPTGERVFAGPRNMVLHVTASARGVAPERLRELVAEGVRCSPMFSAIESAIPVDVRVEPLAEAA